MKPITAASKLDIHLPSAPEEFQRSSLTRSDVEALRANPPEWLVELRRNGPTGSCASGRSTARSSPRRPARKTPPGAAEESRSPRA